MRTPLCAIWLLMLCLFCTAVWATEETALTEDDIYASLSVKFVDLSDLVALTAERIAVLNQGLEALARGQYPPIVNRQLLNNAVIVEELAKTETLRISLALRDAREQHALTNELIGELETEWAYFEEYSDRKRERQRQIALSDSQRQWISQLGELEANHIKIEELLQEKLSLLWQHYYAQEKQQREMGYLVALAEQQVALEEVIVELEALRSQRLVLSARGGVFDTDSLLIDAEIFLLEEKIKLKRIEQRIQYLIDSAQQLADLIAATGSEKTREIGRKEASQLLTALLTLKENLQENVDLVGKYYRLQIHSAQQGLLNERDQQKIQENINQIAAEYKNNLFELLLLEDQLANYLKGNQKILLPSLTNRRGLPGFNTTEWFALGEKITDVPAIIIAYATHLVTEIKLALERVGTTKIALLVLVFLFWLLIGFLVRRYTNLLINLVKDRRMRVTGNLIYVVMQLVRRNLFSLLTLALGLSFFIILGVPFKAYDALLYLVLVWVAFRFMIGVARLLLVERISDVTGQDVRLYHGLKWAFILGGIVSAMTVIVWKLKVAPEVQDLFVRFFMLFLFAVSIILLRGRHVLPSLLKPFLAKRHMYIARATHLLAWLIPLSLMSVATIGLIGYIDLAWSLSYYQMVFVFVAVGYIIIRGLFVDFMDSSSSTLIRNVQNGWLWSEAILKPIDKVLRILLLLGAVIVLFYLYGWGKDTLVPGWISQVLNYNLISFPGGDITFLGIIKLVVTVTIFIWAARWIKEFTYRWLFKSIRDPGIRYSLSVFSQYAMVGLGVIITLRVLGLDFTGMAVILGGLAVGLGFGLRDFANNIVSGVMLLIERPVKEGDLVTVGDFEGEVKRIGIRSMMLQSWDHMEVMVPNSEVFNKIFTNWTHQDDVIRDRIPVKIQRIENVYRVEQLLSEVLTEYKEVLADPEPQIFLNEIDDSLIEYDVRYFINVRLSRRFAVRSALLFAIWKKFAEHDIKPPYSQQHVHIKK